LMKHEDISTPAIRRLLARGGAHRVGEDAVEVVRAILEETVIRVAEDALELSQYAGRITVRAKDVHLARNLANTRKNSFSHVEKGSREAERETQPSSQARTVEAAGATMEIPCGAEAQKQKQQYAFQWSWRG